MSKDEYRCPTYGAEFTTRRGLGVHHSSVHGEWLPNRECDQCGDEFYSDYAKRYCSERCLEEAAPYAGEDNPNYRGGKVPTECKLCGASFEYYPSEKEGVFCSECVENKTWKESPGISGPDHPRWNGGPVQLSCDVCGESFERHPSSITGEATLCGDECRAKWLSDAYTGEGHPDWKGGGNGPYGKGWTRVRREALERDGYQCVICSKTKEEIGRNPDVYHITPVRVFVESDTHEKADAHSLENVVSLCVTCHRKADFGHIPRTELHSVVGIT